MPDPRPRVAVLGTGANGAGIGADLARAGHDVTLIDQWPANVDAVRRNGLRVDTPDDSEVTHVEIRHLCEVAEMRDKFDVVFVLVKAYDTRWACELVKPLLNEDAVVVGVQNGMSIDDMADVLGAERVLGAVIEISANMFVPGVVDRHSPRSRSWFAVGSLTESTLSKLETVRALLSSAGTAELSDDIRSSKWMKLVANAAELVPSAILYMPLGKAAATPGMRSVMEAAAIEAVEACLASGNSLKPIFGMAEEDIGDAHEYAVALLDRVLTHYTLDSTKTTVLQDWMKGRRSEVHEINGHVVRALREVGRAAPVNQRIVNIAVEIESGSRLPGLSNLTDLMEVLPSTDSDSFVTPQPAL